jgi:type IV pilus biogenesis protein CpaD/CtpE
MAKIRSTYRTGILAALTLAIWGISLSSPAQAAGTTTQCTGTLAQYGATIKQIETFSARAQALADQNPLYISDVAYYASVLAEAERCAKNLSAVATVSR